MAFFDEKRYKNGPETDTPFYNLQIKPRFNNEVQNFRTE